MAANNSKSAQERARLQQYQAKQQLRSAKANRRARDNRRAVISGLLAIVIALGGQIAYFGVGPGSSTANPSSSATPSATNSLVPDKALAENRVWTGSMFINNKPLQITLDGVHAPQAVANFISLAKKGYFTNTKCHRLVTSGIYVLQCGDPKGDGTGGPGYSFGPVENAPKANAYKTGDLAMARQGDNGYSMGSQFFIVYQDSTIPADSAGGYTVFGHIQSGGAAVFNPILAKGVEPLVKDGKKVPQTDGRPVVPAVLGTISVK